MTGPEHYKEAERLLAVCAGPQRGSALDAACTAAAQVHAALAVAAAFAEVSPTSYWHEVAGTPRPGNGPEVTAP